MEYENRQPPEGINYEPQGWQRDFVLLVLGFFVGLVLLAWLLLQTVAWGARWVPFDWERSWSQAWFHNGSASSDVAYLNSLAASLAQAGALAPELQLTIHRSDEQTINAFATLGGHIVVFDGLLDAMESEQGLAFVLAHEIAHIHHRDPVQAISRGLTLSLLAGLLFGQSDLAHIAGASGNLALLDYSREQERAADAWALQALQAHYGHVRGFDELFQVMLKESPDQAGPAWLSTHPQLRERIEILEALAVSSGFSLQGELRPLPLKNAAGEPGPPRQPGEAK